MNKRILFCTGIFAPDIGGPATHVLKMAKGMSAEGMDIAIITYSDTLMEDDFGLKVYRIIRSNILLKYLRYFFKVLQIGKDYEVIYLQGSFCDGIPTVLANMFLRKNIIIRIGGIFSWEVSVAKRWTKDTADDFLKNRQIFRLEILKKIDRLVISGCNRVIANSHYMKKLLLLNGIPAEKINIIYNSVDSIKFKEIDSAKYRRNKGLPDKKILLSVGRFFPWKNFDILISVFEGISDEYILVIVGDGPEKEKLQSIISEKNLRNRVFILDKMNQNELHAMYCIADLFVLISSFEGLSHTLIDAMQADLPIIASDIDPNREVLSGYKKSVCINIDRSNFAHAIDKMAGAIDTEDPEALKRFNFANTYKELLKLICAS